MSPLRALRVTMNPIFASKQGAMFLSDWSMQNGSEMEVACTLAILAKSIARD